MKHKQATKLKTPFLLVLILFVTFAGFGFYIWNNQVFAKDAVQAETETAVDAVDKDLYEKPARYGENFEEEIVIKTKDGARHNFTVELALKPDEHAKGLMFRQSMPAMHGMLFIFASNMQRSFWMKNTLIPLDIIFLEEDGRIQHIHSMAKPQDLSHVSSPSPSFAVLELNGGTSYKLGLSAGDYVHHSAFKNKHLE